MAPVPSTSSSEDHTSILQSHHTQLAHFNEALRQSTPEFSRHLIQLKRQPAPEWRLPPPPKPPSKQTQTSAPSTRRGTGGQTTGTSGHTPAEVLNQLNIALRRAHPGGGGGGGGAGPPLGQPAPAGQGQAAVPAAADIKAMGNLPHKFTGNRTKADDFIEEVKAYFHINEDVAEFNSPIKKVAFTLTLIKGDEVAGWVRDIGIWIDRLNRVHDNFPIVWTQFLDEFEA